MSHLQQNCTILLYNNVVQQILSNENMRYTNIVKTQNMFCKQVGKTFVWQTCWQNTIHVLTIMLYNCKTSGNNIGFA